MTYSRAMIKGERPEAVYIVTDGKWHKLYSHLSSARGVKTNYNNYLWGNRTPAYIVRVDVSDGEVVE